MNYEDVLASIHSRQAFSSGASLERITRLMDRLGNPQDRIPTVHVAGTNGKGSVCAMIESAVRAGGFRVGLFTSPYLVDFRERIQIDRQMISKELLCLCYERVMEAELALEQAGFEPVNEFELVTAIGFAAFAEANVDWAVVEVGLGGRFDATNVLKRPEVCCITSVSLDHTTILGNTVAQIAGEKAGIIKPGVPVVMAPQTPEAAAVISRRAKELGSPLTEAQAWKICSQNPDGLMLRNGASAVRLPLLGEYQAENAGAAWAVCRILGLAEPDILRGFSTVRWPGRLQFVPSCPDLLIDAGHNPAGISALCRTLDTLFAGRRIVSVMAMMRDKDYATCIPEIGRRSDLLIAVSTGLPRSLPPDELAREAAAYTETRCAPTVTEGIALARKLSEPDGLIVVCGSVYAAGEAQNSI